MKIQLQTLRKAKGLTQEEMANILDVKLSTYQKYERDAISPPYDTLIKIADFYGVTTDYLLGREKPAEQVNPILQITNEEMERQLLEAYFSLPEKLRKQFLDGMAEKLQKQKNVGAVPQEEKPTQMTTVKSVVLYGDSDSNEDSAQTA